MLNIRSENWRQSLRVNYYQCSFMKRKPNRYLLFWTASTSVSTFIPRYASNPGSSILKRRKMTFRPMLFGIDKKVFKHINLQNFTVSKRILMQTRNVWHYILVLYLFQDGGLNHVETSPLICRANQWTGFYITRTSFMKQLGEQRHQRRI